LKWLIRARAEPLAIPETIKQTWLRIANPVDQSWRRT